jgi:hypothetical protein
MVSGAAGRLGGLRSCGARRTPNSLYNVENMVSLSNGICLANNIEKYCTGSVAWARLLPVAGGCASHWFLSAGSALATRLSMLKYKVFQRDSFLLSNTISTSSILPTRRSRVGRRPSIGYRSAPGAPTGGRPCDGVHRTAWRAA